MKPRLAYIDYSIYGTLMVINLRERGITIVGAETLDDFLTKNRMEDFPALLYHPGIQQQHLLREIPKRFPHLKIACVTSPTSRGDYLSSSLPIFSYNSIDAIEKWVRENQ